MTPSAAGGATSVPAHSPAPNTRLRGRWLVLARVGWLVAVISALALFVGSLPTYYRVLQQPCVGACNVNGG